MLWSLPGGNWQQKPGGFEPNNLSPLLKVFYDQGISVGVSGYGTVEGFPAAEVSLEGLVLASRFTLGFDEVTLLGRSTGAHMVLFNSVLATGPGGADRVCALQTPTAFLPVFVVFSQSSALDHFWPGANNLASVPDEIEVAASSAFWPLVVPPVQGRRVGVIGIPKPLAPPLLPLPLGTFVFGPDTHSAWSSELQAFTLEIAGWDVEFVDTYNGGQTIGVTDATEAWLQAELLP